MANSELQVAPRTVLGKAVRKIRRSGITPANVYGHGIDSRSVQADTIALTRLFRSSSRNAIIDLKVDGEPKARTVVVREVQRNPVNGLVLHVDFYEVSMTEKMRADVPVVLVGTAPAIETHGGVLLQTLEVVAVEALPGDIPAQFEVDVSVLTELEQSVHVSDLAVDAKKVTLHTDPELAVARMAAPRLAEEVAAPEAAAAEGEEGAEAPAEGEGQPEAAEAAETAKEDSQG